jgi:putative oxidoreductase
MTTHSQSLPTLGADPTIAASNPASALLAKLVTTERDPAATAARVALGAVLFPHGAQHALGWFGGYGFTGTLGWMTGTLGFPAPVAALGIVTELVAPLLMLVGFGGRATAIMLAGFMATAASTHFASGFFMNWFGGMKPGVEGFEYHLLAVALAVVVAIKGMGSYSLDRVLFPQRATSAKS